MGHPVQEKILLPVWMLLWVWIFRIFLLILSLLLVCSFKLLLLVTVCDKFSIAVWLAWHVGSQKSVGAWNRDFEKMILQFSWFTLLIFCENGENNCSDVTRVWIVKGGVTGVIWSSWITLPLFGFSYKGPTYHKRKFWYMRIEAKLYWNRKILGLKMLCSDPTSLKWSISDLL